MQIWVYYMPGVGGDGFANLLDWADEISTHGRANPRTGLLEKEWRLTRYVDGSPMFYANHIDTKLVLKRNTMPFQYGHNWFNPRYLDNVLAGRNSVVTSHDTLLQIYNNTGCKDIICRDQVKILLKARDINQAHLNFLKKNLIPFPASWLDAPELHRVSHYYVNNDYLIDESMFDHVVYIDDVLSSWDYTKSLATKLNITIPHHRYIEYVQAVSGELVINMYHKINQYRSYNNNGTINYMKTASWAKQTRTTQ